MPAGDMTGPSGMGPMTGRGLGYCQGQAVPEYANQGWGRGRGGGRGWGGGRGRGWGGGRGRGWGAGRGWPPSAANAAPPFRAPLPLAATREQELEALKDQAGYFERALEELRGRIAEIEAASESEK